MSGWNRSALTVLSLASVLVLVLVAPTSAVGRESSCPELIKRQAPLPQLPEEPEGQGRPTAVSNEGIPIPKATLEMDFGAHRAREVRTQTYRLPKGIDLSTVRVSPVNDFVSGNKPLPIGHEQLTYRAGVDRTTGLVNVRVCYDPGGYAEPAPGRYVGAMVVTAPGVEPVPLTVEFTFRDDGLASVILALLIGIVAGVVVQAIAMYQQAPSGSRPKGWKPYLFNFRTLFAIGAGVVAAITAYSKAVEGDPTWDATSKTLLSLTGATFAAALAAKTAGDLRPPTDREKQEGLGK